MPIYRLLIEELWYASPGLHCRKIHPLTDER